jgi:hypothetical protein
MAVHVRRNRPRCRMFLRIVPLVLLCTLVSMTSLIAGRGDKSGTAAATELLIPVGAAQIGISGAAIATATGVEGIYWNPAGLARTSFGSMVMVSHMSYLAGVNVEYAAAATDFFGLGKFGLAMKALSFGDIPVTTEDQPDGTGETTSPTYLVVGGTFSRRISDRISMGVTVNVIYERMANVSASGVSFNAGVQYVGLGGIDGLEFGVVLKNIGPNMQYDGDGLLRTASVNDALRPGSPLKIEAASNELPSSIDIGLSYTVTLDDMNNIRFSSSFINNNYSEDEYRFGGEYTFRNSFIVRGGYTFASDLQGREYIFGSTFGAGFRTTVYDFNLTVDYAYRFVDYFSGNHVLTLMLGI